MQATSSLTTFSRCLWTMTPAVGSPTFSALRTSKPASARSSNCASATRRSILPSPFSESFWRAGFATCRNTDMPAAPPNPLYTTEWGRAYVGDSLDLLPRLPADSVDLVIRSEEHTSELQSLRHLVC